MRKLVALFSILYLLFAIFVVQAAGLVPCGGKDASGNSEPACNWCFLMEMVSRVINYLIYIIFPLAAIMIVVGGGFIMTAAGSPVRVAKGKEIITAAVIGLLIALLSYLIIDTIIKIIAVGWDNLNIGPWNTLKCS